MLESHEKNLDLIHLKKEETFQFVPSAPINDTVLEYYQGNVSQSIVEYYYKIYLEQLIDELKISENDYMEGKRSDKLKNALALRKRRERKQIYRKIFCMHETHMREEVQKKIDQENFKAANTGKDPLGKTNANVLNLLVLGSLNKLLSFTTKKKNKKVFQEEVTSTNESPREIITKLEDDDGFYNKSYVEILQSLKQRIFSLNSSNDIDKAKFRTRLIQSHIEQPTENVETDEKFERKLTSVINNKLRRRKNTDFDGLNEGQNQMNCRTQGSSDSSEEKSCKQESPDNQNVTRKHMIRIQVPIKKDTSPRNNEPKSAFYQTEIPITRHLKENLRDSTVDTTKALTSDSKTCSEHSDVKESGFTPTNKLSKYSSFKNQYEPDEGASDCEKDYQRAHSIEMVDHQRKFSVEQSGFEEAKIDRGRRENHSIEYLDVKKFRPTAIHPKKFRSHQHLPFEDEIGVEAFPSTKLANELYNNHNKPSKYKRENVQNNTNFPMTQVKNFVIKADKNKFGQSKTEIASSYRSENEVKPVDLIAFKQRNLKLFCKELKKDLIPDIKNKQSPFTKSERFIKAESCNMSITNSEKAIDSPLIKLHKRKVKLLYLNSPEVNCPSSFSDKKLDVIKTNKVAPSVHKINQKSTIVDSIKIFPLIEKSGLCHTELLTKTYCEGITSRSTKTIKKLPSVKLEKVNLDMLFKPKQKQAINSAFRSNVKKTENVDGSIFKLTLNDCNDRVNSLCNIRDSGRKKKFNIKFA